MTKYFFLGASMPALHFGAAPQISFAELEDSYKLNLSKGDFARFCRWRESIDMGNLKRLWLDEGIDVRGNCGPEELEERVLTMSELPQLALDYLHNWDGGDRIAHFPELLSGYLTESSNVKGFAGEYFTFEKELRLCLAAYRAKREGVDLSLVIPFEDPTDYLVRVLFMQKDGPHFEMPSKFSQLEEYLREAGADPIKEHLAVLRFRFEWVAEEIQERQFTIDWLIGFAIMLQQCEESLVA